MQKTVKDSPARPSLSTYDDTHGPSAAASPSPTATSRSTIMDTVQEERERIQQLLSKTQRQQYVSEAAAAAATVERAALERELLLSEGKTKGMTKKEAMSKFDESLEVEAEAKTKLLEITSQLLYQVEDEYNKLYNELQNERTQRMALVRFLQGIHEKYDDEAEPEEPMPLVLQLGGAASTISHIQEDTTTPRLDLSPIRDFESNAAMIASPLSSLPRMDVADRLSTLLKTAQGKNRLSTPAKRLLEDMEKASSSRGTTPRQLSPRKSQKRAGPFGLLVNALYSFGLRVWNFSSKACSTTYHFALASVSPLLYNRSAALVSALAITAAVSLLKTKTQVLNNNNKTSR